MFIDNQNQDPTPDGGTTTTPPTPTPQQADPQVNWESRYKGLQRTLDALQKKFDQLQEQYNQTLGELETERQTGRRVATEKTGSDALIKKLQEENAALQNQVKGHSLEKDRMKLIMDEFPDLAGFEVDGNLPTAESIELLRPKLESFRKRIGSTVNQTVQNKLQGAGPTPAGKTQEPGAHTEDYIYRRLAQLGGRRTPEQEVEYESLMEEWNKLQEKQ